MTRTVSLVTKGVVDRSEGLAGCPHNFSSKPGVNEDKINSTGKRVSSNALGQTRMCDFLRDGTYMESHNTSWIINAKNKRGYQELEG